MNWDPPTIVGLITAVGIGGVLQALVQWFRDRKKTAADVEKTDVETKLAYLNTVIERLDQENKRILDREQRTAQELAAEQERSAKLRARVRELEDELDSVRQSARETQYTARITQEKCDELATRLKELVEQANNPEE